MLNPVKTLISFCLALLIMSTAYASYLPWSGGPLLQLPVPRRSHIPPKKMTLRDAIFLSLRTNPNVQNAEIQRVSDKFALEVARNAFMPQYSFNASALFTNNGIPPVYTFNPMVSMTFATGATASVSYNNAFTGPGGSSITSSITQPLLRGFGPEVTLAPLVSALYNEQNARLALKNTIISTVTTVIQSYYALVQAYNNLRTDELALANSMTTLEQFQIKIDAGQAAPLEITDQQAQVAQLQLTVTQDKNNIQQAFAALMVAIGLDPESKVVIDKEINIKELEIPSIDESTELALANNIAYQGALYTLKQDELNLIVQKDDQRPQLNLTATNTITPAGGTGGTTQMVIVNGVNTNVTTGGLPGNQSTVGLTLNIPIHNLALEQGLLNAQVALEQQRVTVAEDRRTLRTAVITNIQALLYLQQQIVLAENAVKYAQQALDVEIIKLNNGRSTLFAVTQLRTNLTNAQLALIAQEITYINALATFEAELGVTLDKWGIKVYY